MFYLFAAVALPTGAAAQNLLTNGDFDAGSGLTLWVATAGSWDLGADSGSCLLSDSAAGTSADTGGGHFLQMLSEQCIAVDAGVTPTLYLGGLYTTPANVYATLYLKFFTDGTCSTGISFSPTLFGFLSLTWAPLLAPIPIPAGTGSLLVSAEFSAVAGPLPQYTGSFDRLYLGVLPRIFVDGFEAESGSACNWSNIVG
jgi:hypothetical protein